MRHGRWSLQNALLFVASVASAFALSSALWLVWTVVPHFVPVDRGYASTPIESLAGETARALHALESACGTVVAGSLFFLERRRGSRSLIATTIGLVVAGLGGAVLNALGSADVVRTCLCLTILTPAWYGFAMAIDRGYVRTIATIGAAFAAFTFTLACATFFDALGPGAAARARDRDKIAGIRYAGTHYARYPNSPWTQKPKATTDAEMTPLHLEYTPVDRDHYRLCTTFETDAWSDARFPHGTGRTCYTMAFDDSY